MPESTYDALFSTTLSSKQPTVTFSGIPQNYKDLVLIANASLADANGSLVFRVGNGTTDSGNNYAYTYHYGSANVDGSSPVQAGAGTTNNLAGLAGYQKVILTTDIIFSQLNIFNYSSSSTFKSFVGQSLATETPLIEQHSVVWRSNSPIDTITIFNNGGGGQLAAGSTFSLYGLAAAS